MDIRIDRCVLHGPEGDVRRAQRVLMSCPWPPVTEAEVVILRRVEVRSRAERLPARLYQATDDLIGRRVDGWSEAAAGADCVCFRSEGEMLARLSLDLALGRAGGLWFWQSFHRYLVATPPQALAELWLEQAPRLPAVTRVLGERRVLSRVWSRLAPSAVPALIERVIGPAAAGELRRGISEPTVRQAAMRTPVPAPDAPPRDVETLAALVKAFDAGPAAVSRGPDEKGLLALALAVASERPHWIAATDAGLRLIALKAAMSRPVVTASAAPAGVPPAPLRPAVEGPPGRPSRPATEGTDLQPGAPTPESVSAAAAALVSGGVSGDPGDADRSPPDVATPGAAPQVEAFGFAPKADTESNAIPVDAGDVWHIEQGGLFYLLNLLNWGPVRERLFADPEAMAFPSGWGWLYRIGERLALAPEVPLILCLNRLSGMPNGRFPADLPELAAAGEIGALGAERYEPFGVWHPRLLQMPARVVYRRPELDVYFAMSDLEIEVRRAGLDLDPGWIDWLGTIVRFHYR